MAERWAVTGASGYLGRALRENLAAAGIASRGLARTNADITADVRDGAAMRALVRDAGVVVHLAAGVHRRSRGAAVEEECWSVNVDGTDALIAALREVAPAAFAILVSSASVYGPSATALDETAPCRPRTVYGRSKLEAERRFLEAVRAGAIRGCVLRPAMIFGPGAPGNLERLARMVRRGWVVEVGRGAQRKSVVPVGRAVEAIRAVAARAEVCNGEIFNVAGEALSMREIVAALAEGGARRPRVIPVPRFAVRAGAAVASLVAPSLASLAETYISDAVLDGGKLARLAGPEPAGEARRELARVGALSARPAASP